MKCALCNRIITEYAPSILTLDCGEDKRSHAVCNPCGSKLFEKMDALWLEESREAHFKKQNEIVSHTNRRLSFKEMAAIIDALPVSKESVPLSFDPDDYPLS